MLYKDYVERKTANAIRINSAEGYPCVFDNSKGRPLKDYKIYGNSTQDGTPTPDNPVEVQSVGEKTKNLLPNDWESGFISVSSGANQNSLIYVRTKDYFTFDIAKNYYISSDSIDTSTTISWYFYDENKTFIRRLVSYKDRTIGTSDCQVTIPTNTVFFRLAVLTTDINIKVQIEEGSTATEYEPYHKYDIPIVVRGKNLIKYPYVTASRTMNGVKYTVNKDGSVTVGGTATAASYFILNSNVDFGNSSIPENSTNGVYATSEGVRYNVSNHTVSINVASGESVDKIVYPQIEYGTTATEYEPYQGSETIHIYLDEPLRKVRDYTDYIDFKNKKVVRNVVVGVLNGSESWSSSGTRYYFYNTRLNVKCLGTSVAGIKSNALPSKSWTEIRNSGT